MRRKRTFLICPNCNRRGYLIEGRVTASQCVACDWEGAAEELKTHEFYVENVAYTQISYDVIDRIVYLFYGHPDGEFARPHFEMVCNGEWANDTYHQFDVEPVIGKYEEKDAAKFRRDGKPRNLSNDDVMNILCRDGWLEPGRYLVEVCW